VNEIKEWKFKDVSKYTKYNDIHQKWVCGPSLYYYWWNKGQIVGVPSSQMLGETLGNLVTTYVRPILKCM